MAVEIRVPRLGWSMEEGVFVRWLKNDGDLVKVGDLLYELESDKSTQPIEALDAGLLRIPKDAPAPGTVVAVGALLGHLAAQGEEIPSESIEHHILTESPFNNESPAQPGRVVSHASIAVSDGSERVVSSPRARRVAEELGVDWRRLRGSGRSGRVREHDVRQAVNKGVFMCESVPITPRRRLIAERMVASGQRTAPVTLTTRADATNLVGLRNQFKATGVAARAPAYTDIVVKLAAMVLEQHPMLAARWEDDRVVSPTRDQFNIGFAVDTDEGLLVPVLRDVLGKSLARIAEESADLIARARSAGLNSADQQGGVFTITNLGAFGIDAFTPIINPPQTSILGMGAIRREPVVLGDGQIAGREQIWLSLTFDHRVVDGAPAARFLQSLRTAIENPSAWLLRTE